MSNDQINEFDETAPPALRPADLPAFVARRPDFAEFDAPTSPISPMAAPNALSLLVALRRRYKMALGLGPLLAGLVAFSVWYLIPPSKYTAQSLMQVSSVQPKIIFKTEENRVDFLTYQKTQLTLLRSRNVLNKALDDPKVSKLPAVKAQFNPVLWLEKRIQADYLGELFRISMTGDKPDDLAILVNAVSEAYRKEVVELERKERWARRDDLRKIYNEYQLRLEHRREELKKLTQRVGSKDKQTIRFTHELAIERMAMARRELIQYQSELRRVRAEYEIQEARGQVGVEDGVAPPTEVAIQRLTDEDEEVRNHKGQIEKLRTSIARVGRISRDSSDPSLTANRRELETSRKALEARVAALRPLAIERLKVGNAAGADGGANGTRDRMKVLDQLVKLTQEIYDAEVAENQAISQDSIYIDAIQDEIAHADNAAKRIGEELESLRVELEAPPRVRHLETADAPRKEDDKRMTTAGIAGLGTFGLFMLGVALLEFRTHRVSSIEDVNRGVGLRILGTLPSNRDSGRQAGRGGRDSNPYGGSLMGESIDSIRTMILHSTGDRPLGSIMVASATSGEGKTSLAFHLAISLNRSGLKTLLIDCDLRKPTIHRLFDIPGTPGFSEFLRGEAAAAEVIRATTIDGLDAIGAGVCDAQALRNLARADTGAIFDRFRASYDIIVVDTSPILPVTDALLVGRHVDAAVISILRDVSRIPLTVSAVGRLKLMNIRLLGVVVNGVRSQIYGPYYTGYGNEVHHG